MQENKLLKVHQVAEMLEVCKATVWAYAKSNPQFPKPYKLAAKATRWEAKRDTRVYRVTWVHAKLDP